MPLPAHVLVTGARGFVGRHLVHALENAGARVSIGLSGAVLDVTCRSEVAAAMAELRPSAVVHLAAKTYVPDVAAQPRASYAVNVGGTLNVLDEAAALVPAPRVLHISTCSVYGDPRPEDLPLQETASLDSTHPYGLQKIAAEHLCRRARERGLDVIVARPFNHIGAGMNPKISLAHFAQQIANAERCAVAPLLRTGNLAAERDFLHVADVVAAYMLLLQYTGPEWIFNIACGRALSLHAALQSLLALSPLQFQVETDTSRLRAQDPARIVGSAQRLRQATGWSPTREVQQALREILEHARSVVAS